MKERKLGLWRQLINLSINDVFKITVGNENNDDAIAQA